MIPATCNNSVGLAVPIPTFPLDETLNCSLPPVWSTKSCPVEPNKILLVVFVSFISIKVLLWLDSNLAASLSPVKDTCSFLAGLFVPIPTLCVEASKITKYVLPLLNMWSPWDVVYFNCPDSPLIVESTPLYGHFNDLLFTINWWSLELIEPSTSNVFVGAVPAPILTRLALAST